MKIRNGSLNRLVRQMANDCMNIAPTDLSTAYINHLVQYGPSYLIFLQRFEDVRVQMVDFLFFARHLDLCSDFVQPLKIWRILDLNDMRIRFYKKVEAIDVEDLDATLIPKFDRICEFTRRVGLEQESIPLAKLNLSLSVQFYGEKSSCTFGLMRTLGVLYRGAKQFDNAMELLTIATAGFQQTYGDNHPETLATLNDLALLLQFLGRHQEAKDIYLEVLTLREESLGEGHPDTLLSMHNLAFAYENLHFLDQAESLYKRALAGFEKERGMEHPDTLTTQSNLSALYQFQGKWAEAQQLSLQTLQTRELILGTEHPSTVISLNNYAWLLLSLHSTEALGAFERLLENWSDHSDWKHHWALLGRALSESLETGDVSPAENLTQDLQRLLGENHSRISNAREKIENIRNHLNLK